MTVRMNIDKDIIDETYRSISIDHLFLFRIIGILPYVVDDEPNISRRRLKTWFTLICCHTASALFYTMHLAYGIRMLLDHRFEIDFLCDLVVVHGICQRHLLLYLQRRDLLELTRDCRDLWDTFVMNNEIECSVVRGFVRQAYYLRQFFIISGAITLTFYLAWAHIARVPVTSNVDNNITLYRRILPLKFYTDVQEEPWYSLVAILQALVSSTMAIILTGIETVGPFLAMMACGYLRNLRNRLMSMAVDHDDDDDDHQINKSMLGDLIICIKFHQKVLQLCEKIGRFTRVLFMIQVSCTLYNMSLIGFKLLVSDDSIGKSLSILLMILAQFFSCQWISQYLTNESEAISTAAYAAVKVHRPLNVIANRMLLLMILRADKPIQLTAGGIIRLSYESFQKLLVNAFSMFTVLRSFLA